MKNLTAGITTRNRPESVVRCVQSLRSLAPFLSRVIVFDDSSDRPVSDMLTTAVPDGVELTVMRDEGQVGNIVGRNRMMAEAATPYVLLLDDDAVVLSAASVESAIAILERDQSIAAVAFAQAEKDGSPWPEPMQPGRGTQPAYVSAFIGFAHLLRRDAFLRLGGYRERFVFYGEEKDFCLRMLSAGLRVVYLPHALVGHLPDPAGRSTTRYLRFVTRNEFLYSFYNEPWAVVAVGLPLRFWRYRKMAAQSGAEPGGIPWIVGELGRSLPDVWRNRRAVSWSTFREWRRLARTIVPYPPAGGA
jgi:GT2 family glycosyltransferase